MIVAIICVVAIVVALGYLGALVGGLLRRIRDLDAELGSTRTVIAGLNEVLEQAPHKSG